MQKLEGGGGGRGLEGSVDKSVTNDSARGVRE